MSAPGLVDGMSGVIDEIRASGGGGSDSLPAPVAAALVRSRLPAMCVPARLGGGGRQIGDLAEACATIARVDAGVAWALFILGTSPWLISRARPELAHRLYSSPDRLVSGVLAPMGAAVRQTGGWRLSGTWRFASAHAVSDSVMLMGRVDGGGQLLFAVPAAAVAVAEPWDGLGLGSSGSATVRVTDLAVPDRDTIDLASQPEWPEAAFRLPFKATFAAAAAILIGLAEEALDVLVRTAVAKRPTFGRTTLSAMSATKAAVARLDGAIGAARLLLFDRLEEATAAAAGRTATAGTQAALRIAMHHACDTALGAIDLVHRLSGGEGARHGTPISRILRDAHTAGQHYMFSEEVREAAGAVLLGGQPDLDRL